MRIMPRCARRLSALKSEGLTNLLLIPGDGLFGQDADASVDGSHPSDLGFVRQADILEPLLRAILDQ